MDIDLIHYSAQPIDNTKDTEQTTKITMDKPDGLWVSIEDGRSWKDIYEDDSSYNFNDDFTHKIHIDKNANILHLKSADEIFAFTEKFKISLESHNLRTLDINWSKATQEYQGIIIAPYQHACHTSWDCEWYHGWDCSSGCIWDSTAISNIERIHPSRPKVNSGQKLQRLTL